MIRFDVVVFNWNRLHCFVNNFHLIRNFDAEHDRLSLITNSSNRKERDSFFNFCNSHGFKKYRYLSHRNFGMAEKARLDYFSGKTGG